METAKCKRMEALDWNLLRDFHATAPSVPLPVAAGQLGLTHPKLSRQVAARPFPHLGHKLDAAVQNQRS